MNNQGIAVFGEVLFDQFPDGLQVLGGAPFNVLSVGWVMMINP
jgi:fructokinase